MRKKMCVLALALALAVSLSPAFAAEKTDIAARFPAVRTYEGFSDVRETDWFAPYVQVCYETGLMEGTGEKCFSPEYTITVAEAETLAARLHHILNGGDGTLPAAPSGTGSVILTTPDGTALPVKWVTGGGYSDSTKLSFYIQIDAKSISIPPDSIQLTIDHSAVFYGQLTNASRWTFDYTFSVTEEERQLYNPYVKLSTANGPFLSDPSDAEDAWFWSADLYLRSMPGATEINLIPILTMAARRTDLFQLLSFVLPVDTLEPINQITCLTNDDDPELLPFYRAGILTGIDSSGTFNGHQPLTRAEAAAMLARIIRPDLRVTFTPAP